MLEFLLKIADKYEKLVSAGGFLATLWLIFITNRYNKKIIEETKKNIKEMEKSNQISKNALEVSKMEIEEGKRVRDLEVVSDLIEKKIIDECFLFLLDKRNFKKYIEKMRENFRELYVEDKLKTERFENIGDCIIDKKNNRIYYSTTNRSFKESFNFVYKLIEDLKFLEGILEFKPYKKLIKKITDEGEKLHNYNFYKDIHEKIIMKKLGTHEKLKFYDINKDKEVMEVLIKMWGYNKGFEKQLNENSYYFESTEERIGELKNIYNNFEYFKKILNKNN